MKLDWSKLPENPTMEDLQKFLMEQLNPGGEQELGEDGLPEGLDPSMFPEGFDYTKVDWSQFPPGFDWSQIPEDFDWFSLMNVKVYTVLGEEDNTNGSGPKEEEPMYVVPFLLTPRPPYTPTPVKEIEHHTYDYITTPRDTAGSSSVKHEEKKDTPYTGEHSAAAAAACHVSRSLSLSPPVSPLRTASITALPGNSRLTRMLIRPILIYSTSFCRLWIMPP